MIAYELTLKIRIWMKSKWSQTEKMATGSNWQWIQGLMVAPAVVMMMMITEVYKEIMIVYSLWDTFALLCHLCMGKNKIL